MTPTLGSSIHRLIDANLDRVVEGLRVVGELLRFVAEREDLTASVRDLRHNVVAAIQRVPQLQKRAIAARDSESDVGRGLASSSYRDVLDVAHANWSRAQESIRTLEEVSRAYVPGLADALGPLRYDAYVLEQATLSCLSAFVVRSKLDFGLYVVLGQKQQMGRDFETVTRAAIAGGAECIQLRAKELGKRDILDWARRLRGITAEAGVTFVINDHIDIALAAGADGVHLGQDDLPIPEARAIAGPDLILGASTHSLDQALVAEQEGASYINVGPVFPTMTKEGARAPVGPELLGNVLRQIKTPMTCMGGINAWNIGQVLAQGASRVAVVSAVVGADDIAGAARELAERIRDARDQGGDEAESPAQP